MYNVQTTSLFGSRAGVALVSNNIQQTIINHNKPSGRPYVVSVLTYDAITRIRDNSDSGKTTRPSVIITHCDMQRQYNNAK